MFFRKKVDYHKDDPSLFLAPETVKSCAYAWLFPGAGHWYLGRRQRALVICLAMLAAFGLGLVQGGDIYPFSGEGAIRSIGAFCEMGLGVPHLLARLLVGRGTPIRLTYDYGTIYFLIAGMVNWLAVVDTFDIAVGRK